MPLLKTVTAKVGTAACYDTDRSMRLNRQKGECRGVHTIQYGVIGLKRAGLSHIAAALANDNVKLVALVDVDEGLVKSKAEELGVEGFTDHRMMLDKGIVDAVSIALPNHLHCAVGLDCLNAGAHIFTEKPFTTRVSEADTLIEAAQNKSLKIGVNYLYRMHHSSRILKDHIDSGAIGRVMRVLWTWGHLKSESYYTDDPWRGSFRDSGGGVLMSNASHELDLIRWLIGAPSEVSACIGNQLHNVEIEDIVCASVRFANGALGSLQFSVNQPPAYSVRQIAGDKGIVILPNVRSLYTDKNDEILLGRYETALTSMVLQFKDKPDPSAIHWQSIHAKGDPKLNGKRAKLQKFCTRTRRMTAQNKTEGIDRFFHSFVEAILNDTEPFVSGVSARSAIEFINGIILSAMRKKTVRFPLDGEEYDELYDELAAGTVKVPRFR